MRVMEDLVSGSSGFQLPGVFNPQAINAFDRFGEKLSFYKSFYRSRSAWTGLNFD